MRLSEVKSQQFIFKSAVGRIEFQSDGTALVTGIQSNERGQGHAKGLLQKIIDYLDSKKLSASLSALAIDDNMTPQGLMKLYSQFGFVSNPDNKSRMTRKYEDRKLST